MQRDRGYLVDILEAAKLATSYIQDKTQEDFLRDSQCQDAVIRRFEIIGEAARRVSDNTRAHYPKLPWHQMIAMRNVMIHQYDDIDMALVWETVRNNLADVITELEKILRD